MKEIIEVENLDVRFLQPQGELRALRGVDLTIQVGEILCVVGESGCGKSVLCKTIAGLLCKEGVIHSGAIRYEGVDLLACSKQESRTIRKKAFAVVLQNPQTALDPVMKVGRQMDEVLKLHRPELSKPARRLRLLDALKQVGIHDPVRVLSQYPHALSGGMKQRVVIATALLKEPSVLLADEPTTALDPTVAGRILDLFADVHKRNHMTIVLVLHDLAAAYHFASRVAIMYAGKIVEIGTKEDVFSHPLHPYTKALLDALPSRNLGKPRLPDLSGFAFSEEAMRPFSSTHWAAVPKGASDAR